MRTISQSPGPIAAPSIDRSDQTAHAFYEAINHFLADGDASQLERLLAPDFRNHPSLTAEDETTSGFFRYLASVRLAYPGIRLDVRETSGQGNFLVVDLEVEHSQTQKVPELPLGMGPQAAGYELLRISSDRVVERWATSKMPLRYESLFRVNDLLVPGAIGEPRIERLEFESNSRIELIDRDGFVLVMESGELSFTVESGPSQPTELHRSSQLEVPHEEEIPNGGALSITSGDLIAIPKETRIRAANSSAEPATALVIAIRQQSPSDLVGATPYLVLEAAGVERILLAGGVRLRPNDEPVTISVTRATLAPGLETPRHTVVEGELMVVTEGSLNAIVHEGGIKLNRPGSSYRTMADQQIVLAGEGISAGRGVEVEYQAEAQTPTTIWFVRIEPTPTNAAAS